MEEILASIRRIISEDGAQEENGEDAADAAPAPAPAAEPEVNDEEEEEGVFELTEVVDEPQATAAAGPEVEMVPAADPDPEPEETPEEVPMEEPTAAAPNEDAALISPPQADAATRELSELVSAVNRKHDTSLLTFQEMVKEVMRPMIKDWLDANLPDLVERVVTREVQRLARRAEGE